ncbi:MAG: hypothetical protein CMN78_06415 [Spirochaetales bacterium]|nr:hypothetical protein [Spirochaetales bacterium]
MRFSHFNRNIKLFTLGLGLTAISFFGIQGMLKVIYVLRLGFGPEYIGIFNSMGAVVYMIMGIPSGWLGKKFGSRRMLLLGSAITAGGMFILPLTHFASENMVAVLPILHQIVQTIGWSLLGVNITPTVMLLTTPENRNEAYALLTTSRWAGALIGSLIGGLLPGLFASTFHIRLTDPAPYNFAIWLGTIFGIAGLVPLLMTRRYKEPAPARSTSRKEKMPLKKALLLTLYAYLGHSGFAAVVSFGNAYMDTDLHVSTTALGVLMALGQLASACAPFLAPFLAKRRGNEYSLLMAPLLTAIALVPAFLFPHWAAIAAARIVVLGTAAIWMPALQVFQMESFHPTWRTLVYGIVSTGLGLCFASVSLSGGYLSAHFGYRSTFLVGFILSVLSFVAFWIIMRMEKGKTLPTN